MSAFNLLCYPRLTCILALDVYDDDASLPDSTTDFRNRSHDRRTSTNSDPETRQIEPRQNWLAKLFNIKPAVKTICFSVSNRRARQEIVTILKEWKRYGIRELQVDKKRNIVFGKVAAKNCKLLVKNVFVTGN